MDLAAVNSASDELSVLLGSGDAAGNGVWFGSPSYWTISGAPSPGGIAAADFYGQANPDLVVADSSAGSGNNSVTVLLNGGGTPATTNASWTGSGVDGGALTLNNNPSQPYEQDLTVATPTAALNFAATTPFTISAWVRLAPAITSLDGNCYTILSRASSDGSESYELALDGTGTNYGLRFSIACPGYASATMSAQQSAESAECVPGPRLALADGHSRRRGRRPAFRRRRVGGKRHGARPADELRQRLSGL